MKKILNKTLICLALILTTMSTLPTLFSSTTSHPNLNLYDIKPDPPMMQNSSMMQNPSATIIQPQMYYSNPWPIHDELTEIARYYPSSNPTWLVDYHGYWYSNRGINLADLWKVNEAVIGNYSMCEQVYQGNHCLWFYFNEESYVAQWNYIKYFQVLSPGCNGYCEFAFFCFDPTYTYVYWAISNYTQSTDGQFYPHSFNIWDPSDWVHIDSQFDWNRVTGFVFWAITNDPISTMGIDSPILYSSDQDMPYGTIDFKWVESDSIRLCTELIHCGPEYVEQYDQWMIHCTVKNKLPTGTGIYIPFVKLMVICDDVAMVFPDSYEPKNGRYETESFMSWSVPYMGISIPITLPKLNIEFTTYTKDNLYYMQWICQDPLMGSALLGTNVITDANDFVVPFIVPNGFKPYVCVMVEAQFYEIHQHTYRPPISDIILYYFTSSLYKKEQQALTVDPPECVTIYPEEEDPVDLPLNQTSGAYVSSIGLRGTNFVVNGNFESTYGWEIHNANVVNDVKHSGSQSMEIENTGHIVQYLSCLGIYGDEAVLSLWGLPQQIGNEALLIVVYEDNSFYYEVLTMTQTVWSQFTSYPAEHKILKEVHICGDIGTVYIDDVEGCITDRFPTRKLIKVCANITWNIEEWKPTILVELTDALGNKFTLSEFQMICSNGTNTCDILCFVPRNAIVGLATINISLWNTWHTNPNAEMYICQSNRECEIIQGPSGGGGGGGGECYLV